ncbi:glycosyltransferase family 2 protein [Taibaiella koreensis]|uniref:glycosyltransferase family 2 protein n=1 Tax=Taibaiella koreensis TaxID=1268548 RepID=UPI0019693CAC|nr:glycosyltransferase family 2 protein [Taibaiella koreensis]
MEETIKVSIITPSYNQGQFIEATIQSVLNQSYRNIQYIVVDGGSTDNTMEIVERYRDRIDIVIHEKDKGQSDAINKGFRLATGTLAGWINSDDLLKPTCVEEIVALYRQYPGEAIFYGALLEIIDGSGKVKGVRKELIDNRETLLRQNYNLVQPGSFYNLEIMKSVGFVNEAIHYSMDLDLWLRLLQHGGIKAYQEKPLASFRIWEESKTSTGKRKFVADIDATLARYKAPLWSPNRMRLKWYDLKIVMKSVIKSKA